MRNYNSKSHIKPLAQNSFRKSDRNYPDPKPIVSLRNSICQKSPEKKCNQRQSSIRKYENSHNTINNIAETYFLLLQNPAVVVDRNSNIQQVDNTCLWFRNIQKYPNKGVASIKFKATQYIIGEWTGDQYPHLFFITIDGIFGYNDQYGKPSNRVLALKLREIQPYINEQNIQVYELRYSSTNQTSWRFPTDMTHIKIGMKQDSNEAQMMFPLPNPIVLEFQLMVQ